MTRILRTTKVLEGCHPDKIPDEVYSSTEPVILKGLVKNWPLVQAGLESNENAIDLLKSFYSGKPASIYFGAPGTTRFAYNSDLTTLNFDIRKAQINDVLDEILASINDPEPPVRYIASNIIDIYFPKLIEENNLPFNAPYFEQHPLEFADPLKGIWIGNKTLSPCHYDAQSNIACCVVGTRKATLFPPDQIHNLYPGPLDLNPGGPAITLVDFDNPDFEKYPRYADAIANGQIAELEAGDALFIPCMWWHQIEALSPFNVLINYWWNSFPKIRGQAMNALNLALLSIRDRPEQEKQAWKHLFDYYVFGDNQLAGEHIPEVARGVLGKIDDNVARHMRAQLLQKLNR
ncbi:MAG: cupin-like domain-containing protein [Cellvibrio sp.]